MDRALVLCECNASGPVKPSEAEAIAAWNTRAADQGDWQETLNEVARLEAEVERLREELRKAKQAHWFYLGDVCESDRCRDCIDECISEDFEWDNKPEGDHVLLVTGARPVPDMWVSLHYYTDAEKDERDSHDEYTYTVHATQDEARQALGGAA